MRSYLRSRNNYEVASIICSLGIILYPIIGDYVFHLFPQGGFSAISHTIFLATIPGILALVGRSISCGILALVAAFSPVLLFWLSHYVAMFLYLISFGNIKPV